MMPDASEPSLPAFSDTVSGQLRDGVLVVTIDNPPVNAASASARSGLMAAIRHAAASQGVRAMVITGSGRTFVGGADIKEFGTPPVEPTLPAVIEAIEACEKPMVAAINGAALGGGCEIILACHHRVADAVAKVGLPEVKLGIVPGAGGTQRLPRLIGLVAAAELIASGRIASAAEAMTLGLVDEVVESGLLEKACAAALGLAGKALRRTGDVKGRPVDAAIFEQTTAKILSRARGQHAPAEAVRLVRLAESGPLAEGLAEERATFLRLRDSDQAKALRHVFFAERAAAKVAALDGVSPRTVETVGVVGAGLMGAGIAIAALDAGFRLIVVEQSEERALAGRERIVALLDRAVKSGRLSPAGRAERLERLTLTPVIDKMAAADLVIEAVFDDLEVKTELFKVLDRIVRPDSVLATNTSYLDPDVIAAVTRRPENVLGLHFFSPANVMRLVEVVRCAKTAPEVLATGLAFAKKLGKLPVVSGVCEGFIGNRIFSAYRREAEFLVEEGSSPHEVDAAMKTYGFAMGPFTVSDLAGLEISWARRKRQQPTRSPNERYVDIADRLCEAGRFGQKTGRGWYAYRDGMRTVDPDVTALIEAARAHKGVVPRSVPDDEIVARLLSTMVAEGDALLAEGIAARSSDIDLVMINGYGFPAYRGGPMFASGALMSAGPPA